MTPAVSRQELFERVRAILESARASVSRSVNTAQVIANWMVGREIVEEQQLGRGRAAYGAELLRKLANKLSKEFGVGYSVDNLELFRRFYLEFPQLIAHEKSDALRRNSTGDSPSPISIHSSDRPRQTGLLNPNLSWTHYRVLLRISGVDARAFYEIEAAKQHWSARQLERQTGSLLYERLAKSRDKIGLMRLATRGAEPEKSVEIFKDPTVIEFLGIPKTPALTESTLESALLSNLQAFLLELGTGFAFVARQQRITLDGDHFYIDLVFYHAVLKCFVIVDLKVGKLTHADLGQLQLYVNYYDLERRTPDDNPTLGLILCSDKNDAVVKYTLGPNQEEKIFASRYKLHLPSEADLRAQLRVRRSPPPE